MLQVVQMLQLRAAAIAVIVVGLTISAFIKKYNLNVVGDFNVRAENAATTTGMPE